MYTEIRIETRQYLPVNLGDSLNSLFGPSADFRSVLNATVFKNSRDLLSKIVYAYDAHDKIFLVFVSDVSTLKIHVEHAQEKDRFESMMACVDETFHQFKKYIARERMRIRSAQSAVFSENCKFLNGTYITRRKKFLQLMRNDVFLEIYVPSVTFAASYWMHEDMEKSFYNMTVALVATFVWLLVKTFTSNVGFNYSTTYENGTSVH